LEEAAVRGSVSKVAGPAAFASLGIGLLLLASGAFVSAWPDMEASLFDATTASVASARLGGLRCPVLMAEDEPTSVRAALNNRGAVREAFLVRARISAGFVSYWRQDSQQVVLDPGRSLALAWPVTAADAAYGRLVLARVLATRGTRLPARQQACGILVIPVRGVSGGVVFAGWLAVGLAFILCAAALLLVCRASLGPRARRGLRALTVATAITFGALLAGVAGWWLVSHAALVLAALVLVASLVAGSEAY
jgi:hypothetical protein